MGNNSHLQKMVLIIVSLTLLAIMGMRLLGMIA